MLNRKILENVRRHQMEKPEEKTEQKGARVFNFTAPCTYIEKQEIIVQAGGTFYNGPKPAEEETTDKDKEIVDKLQPIFYGERKQAEDFLKRIKGATAMGITSIVNALLKNKVISDASCYKPLWEVLHSYNLYDKTYSNWTDKVRKLV